jgi:translation initiation factor 2 alpha subunit (eIF-2alpha)
MNNSFVENNSINFYKSSDPLLSEPILVKFIEKTDDFFKAILCEYIEYIGILNFQNATKKKKIYKWNKVVKLNKPVIANIINIDTKKKIVELSLIDIPITETNDNNEEKQSLVKYFNDNKYLENFIKSFTIQYTYNFTTIWQHLIYHIDDLRQVNNSSKDKSILDYISTNIGELESWVLKSDLNEDTYKKLKNYYDLKFVVEYKRLSTKLSITSLLGVNLIKDIINKIIYKNNSDSQLFRITYISSPYYLLESSSKNTNLEDHCNLINLLIDESKNYNGIYISKTV